MKRNNKRIFGFTLVEIMIVVTIIGILASLSVPAFQRARWKAVETSIRNNLRQMWGAAQQYMLENGLTEISMKCIVAYRTKAGVQDGTDGHYTSVIQQVADEDYGKIGAYGSGALCNYTDDAESDDGFTNADGNTVGENTQGLIIKANNKYVKLKI